jgi:hypothetical protein
MQDALLTAFRAAHYRFDTVEGDLLLMVDLPNRALAALLHDRGADCTAVLTAFNPQGSRQNNAANRQAQDMLLRDIQSGGYAFLPGRNEDPCGEWPVEESFLILGMDIATGQTLAARYGQLAFLWTDATSATPRLIETATAAALS